MPFKLSRPLDDTSFFELFLYSILIPFSTISESFNLIFSFSLIYLSFKKRFFLMILSRHITKPNPVSKYV